MTGGEPARIAKEFHYSRFHLHRMFTGAVGMPPCEYITRRRLTESADCDHCDGGVEISVYCRSFVQKN